MDVKIDEIIIASYVEEFINTILKPNVTISVTEDKQKYIINTKEIPIFKFWNFPAETLLHSFQTDSFHGDYVGTIFFFLSGYWEYVYDQDKDSLGRCSFSKSFIYKKNLVGEPIVDILVKRLSVELHLKYRKPFSCPRLLITHDIDLLSMFGPKRFAGFLKDDILHKRDFKGAWEKIKLRLRNSDPHSVYNLIRLHEQFQTNGSFFFMTEKQPKQYYGGYNARRKQRQLIKLFNALDKRNHTIGVHYHVNHLEADNLPREIRTLEKIAKKKVVMGRAHYLIFDIQKSFTKYEEAGIHIDTSGGYGESIGFRFGTSIPFKPFCFQENRPFDFYEIPLIVMDGSLKTDNYMHLTPEEAFEKVKKIVDKVKISNGVFCLLWHNTSFYTGGWNEWDWVYEGIIKYCQDKNFRLFDQDELERIPLSVEDN